MKIIYYMKQHKVIPLVLIIYLVLAIAAPDKALQALGNSSYYLIEMVQIMPVIFLLTVSIDLLIPKSWILQNMGDNAGIKGGLLALIFGSVSAGPIYAAFPVTKMLLKKGASVGNIVIILSAWAVIKVPMLANEAKFLGPTFMATRWVLTVMAIFIMGWVMNRTVKVTTDDGQEAKGPLVAVSDDYCIGCGLCTGKIPEVFMMAKGKAIVVANPKIKDHKDTLQQISEKCPAQAITLQF